MEAAAASENLRGTGRDRRRTRPSRRSKPCVRHLVKRRQNLHRRDSITTITSSRPTTTHRFGKAILGYPAIAVLLLLGLYDPSSETLSALAGVPWKELNQRYRNDYDRTLDDVFERARGQRLRAGRDSRRGRSRDRGPAGLWSAARTAAAAAVPRSGDELSQRGAMRRAHARIGAALSHSSPRRAGKPPCPIQLTLNTRAWRATSPARIASRRRSTNSRH